MWWTVYEGVGRASGLAAARPGSALAGAPAIHAALLVAFLVGDATAREVVLDVARPLGRVLGRVIGTLGARDIVLIGPMTEYGEPWLDEVRAEAQRSDLPLLVERSTIHLGRAGDDVVELGAAPCCRRRSTNWRSLHETRIRLEPDGHQD